MKAMVMAGLGLGNLRLTERPDPVPGPGEVLVRLRAASLNYRDLLVVEGGYGSRQRTAGLVPLSDGAGEVVDLGPGAQRWRPGDRVVGCFFPDWPAGPPTEPHVGTALGGNADGVAAEFRVFREETLLKIPDSLDFLAAASLPCAGVTAWSAIRGYGAIGPEHRVLTQGTGGVALFALQFARLAGAEVIATSSSPEKLARLRALGAGHAIDYRADPDWGRTARVLSGGQGVDHVVETGGAGTLKQSMRAVRVGGTITIIGVVSGGTAELNLAIVAMNSLRLQGLTVGGRDRFADMLAAIERHRLQPVLDRAFPLAELPQALDYLRSGRHVGKVGIEIG